MGNKIKQQFLVIKTIWTDEAGVSHPDYQMIENTKHKPLETVQKEILDHSVNTHPEYLWSVDVYDADHMPPEAIPEGTSFTIPTK